MAGMPSSSNCRQGVTAEPSLPPCLLASLPPCLLKPQEGDANPPRDSDIVLLLFRRLGAGHVERRIVEVVLRPDVQRQQPADPDPGRSPDHPADVGTWLEGGGPARCRAVPRRRWRWRAWWSGC